jgi:hypothetical protein
MSDSTHKAPRSTYKVAADSNEFYMPIGTEKMVHDKYKEWVKRREGRPSSTVKFYPRSHKV